MILWALIAMMALAQDSEVCYRVTCEKLPNKCSEKSDLDFTIKLSDQCDILEHCDINDQYSGVCKTKNFYIDPVKLYPGDPCDDYKYDKTCYYGKQRCADEECASVGHNGACI